ncbi:ribosomal-protein-alanine N-acetyltransferase [Austwickia chelonae]|uniref:Putative ribosomal-protein-alanine acetyltransferase n=1 Tax=Austwickia chelonae NBRC 105200 TaxID=1184607 RepID=K6VRT9_9MICO|nr:ribosomal protein S18-alanine N-acetyltransferase [Austwickia chelonae]GAB78040.1 putative ribosomal-protein-alanine acetyltransferase [Austwickia chelonae NBRC 105200]SEV94965.1 ribosomal-protein-alanine N-acetyltransferase [Austwickia chelonae]
MSAGGDGRAEQSLPSPGSGASVGAVLRVMRWQDIPVLAGMEAELFHHDAWSENTWWSELAGRPRRTYVVGEDEEGICGYAGLDLGGEVADVMTVAVAPRAQGRGYGRMLLDWLMSTARHAGARYLMLEVRADNDAAIGLYETAGFMRLSVRRRYYQPGDVDAYIMRKELCDDV